MNREIMFEFISNFSEKAKSFTLNYYLFFLSVFLFLQLVNSNSIFSQVQQYQKDNYILGNKENILTIVVHIWGEVNRPGEYIVSDGTNVLELISKAGGPTIYSNLSHIVLTRGNFEDIRNAYISNDSITVASQIKQMPKYMQNKQIIKINLKDYLETKSNLAPVILKPGDVIIVKRNMWYKWQSILRVVSQIAIFIQAWYWFSRINK